jgi:hypothetical protein
MLVIRYNAGTVMRNSVNNYYVLSVSVPTVAANAVPDGATLFSKGNRLYCNKEYKYYYECNWKMEILSRTRQLLNLIKIKTVVVNKNKDNTITKPFIN